jgi:hypothetical protein
MHIGFLRKMAGRSCEMRYEKQNAKKKQGVSVDIDDRIENCRSRHDRR